MVSLKQAPDVLVFDMDGVLVEVTESYREAIRETVKHFTGELVSHDLIQDFKNAGGWNNDWLLSQRLIADRGKNVDYAEVVEYFNAVFLGQNGDGLIRKEKWLPNPGLLGRLSEKVKLAIFTGRAKYEADATLNRHAPDIIFEPLVTDDSVPNPKPAPDGLQLIQSQYPNRNIWYLGDTVDDARSAQGAGVPFIGVSTPHNPRHAEIADLLRDYGALAVINDINQLEALVHEAGRN
ncbi:MAG: HAD hydrolase-like protein [Acidobacteriaceae bacterium]|nr:HAD hydrolase-like protein [Acidobacteriaceae bacterium]